MIPCNYSLSELYGIKKDPKTDMINSLIDKACDNYYISRESFFSRKRGTSAMCRQIVAYVLLNSTNMSLSSIGAIIGRDHATVIHSRRSISNLIETNKTFRDNFRRNYGNFIESISQMTRHIPEN